MPTYEYVCPKCDHHFEQFQSMKDEPLKVCPHCHQAGLKRLIGSGAGLIFKGTGFYITDYKKTTPPKEGGDSKAGGGEGGSKSGESKTGSSESKASGSSSSPSSGSSSSGSSGESGSGSKGSKSSESKSSSPS